MALYSYTNTQFTSPTRSLPPVCPASFTPSVLCSPQENSILPIIPCSDEGSLLLILLGYNSLLSTLRHTSQLWSPTTTKSKPLSPGYQLILSPGYQLILGAPELSEVTSNFPLTHSCRFPIKFTAKLHMVVHTHNLIIK